jgi:hypothetical protein
MNDCQLQSDLDLGDTEIQRKKKHATEKGKRLNFQNRVVKSPQQFSNFELLHDPNSKLLNFIS